MEKERAGDWARPVVHWELVARDPAAQAEFYRRLFNWDVGDGDIRFVAPGLGGPEPGPGGHIIAGGRPGVLLYVQVGDIRISAGLVEELGGALSGPPFDVPGGPTLCYVTDPEDNPLVLVQQ